jgi:hypothetical protein
MAAAIRRFSTKVLGARPRASMWSSQRSRRPPKVSFRQRDPSLRRLIDELRRRLLGIASATMDGGVRVPVAMGVGVATKRHPDVPNAWRAVT